MANWATLREIQHCFCEENRLLKAQNSNIYPIFFENKKIALLDIRIAAKNDK